jgi:tetratricopeptide (TPR) repeat protein
MGTIYQTPTGDIPTEVALFAYEEGDTPIEAVLGFKGGTIRLDFHDFSDLQEMSAGEQESSKFPQPIVRFEYMPYAESGVFMWLLETERCTWAWISEYPVERGKEDFAAAKARSVERDRKYRVRRALQRIFHRLLPSIGRPLRTPLNKANRLLNEGITAQESGKYDLAEKCYRQSLALYSRHRDVLTWAKGHHQMGNVNIGRRKWGSARRWHLRSLELARIHSLSAVETHSLYWLGHIELSAMRGDFGFEYFRQSWESARHGNDTKDLANALLGMGTSRTLTGDFDEASRYLEGALAADEQLVPRNVLRQLQSLSSLVNCCVLKNDIVRAREVVQQAETVARQRNDAEALQQVQTMRSLVERAKAVQSEFDAFQKRQKSRRE